MNSSLRPEWWIMQLRAFSTGLWTDSNLGHQRHLTRLESSWRGFAIGIQTLSMLCPCPENVQPLSTKNIQISNVKGEGKKLQDFVQVRSMYESCPTSVQRKISFQKPKIWTLTTVFTSPQTVQSLSSLKMLPGSAWLYSSLTISGFWGPTSVQWFWIGQGFYRVWTGLWQ